MRQLGLFGLTIPEAVRRPRPDDGGGGAGDRRAGQDLARLPLGDRHHRGHRLAGHPDRRHDEQKAQYLPRLATGELIASFALTEPDAGSDAASLRTTRRSRDGDHYVVNGTKRYITNAPQAGLFTLMARTNPADKGAGGVSAFIVDADIARHQPRQARQKMGQRGAHTCDVIFENCRVPAANLIGGSEGQGFKTAMKVLDKGRIHIAAVCVGVAERMLDDALRYAMERRQFGQPIAEFQLVQAMLADSQTEIYAARCMVIDAARRRDDGENVAHRGVVLQAVRLRDVRPRRRPRGADLRRRRLHRPTTASSASTATCACSASTRARARSSSSSSRAT